MYVCFLINIAGRTSNYAGNSRTGEQKYICLSGFKLTETLAYWKFTRDSNTRTIRLILAPFVEKLNNALDNI